MSGIDDGERDQFATYEATEVSPFSATLGEDPVEVITPAGRHLAKVYLAEDGSVLMSNEETGMTFSLPPGNTYAIGRDHTNDSFFGAETLEFVSGYHFNAHIEQLPDGQFRLIVRDANSSNGTSCRIVPPAQTTRKKPLRGAENKDLPQTLEYNPHTIIAHDTDAYVSSPNRHYQALTALAGGSSKGYKDNQDSVMFDADDGVIAVADGMGGYGKGSLASSIVLASVSDEIKWGTDLAELPQKAHERLRIPPALQGPEDQKSGATLAVIKKRSQNGQTYLDAVTVGDAKAIVVSMSQKRYLYDSKEQSATQDALDNGTLTPETAFAFPLRNQVNNAIRVKDLKEPPVVAPDDILVQPGDIAIVCSDGVTDLMSPEEITAIVLEYGVRAVGIIYERVRARELQEGGFDTICNGKWTHVNTYWGDNGGDNVSIALMVV